MNITEGESGYDSKKDIFDKIFKGLFYIVHYSAAFGAASVRIGKYNHTYN